MDVSTVPQLVRSTGRFSEVASILAKYGLAGWLSGLRAEWVQRLFRSQDGKKIGELPTEVRIRLAITELGTTFIKLGQILSTRPDLVGVELADELAKLQSGAPADPPETVRGILASEFGRPVDELFAEFDDQALAAASMAQIHRARLADGRQVVVKIQHEGIEDRITNDLDILTHLARLAQQVSQQLRQYQPVETAAQFSRTLLRELDFEREARNMREFARNFRGDDGVRFPVPIQDATSRRVLTMDYLEGVCVSDSAGLAEAGVDLSEIARRGAELFVEMIFRDGFYHADPHPGNLLVLSGDVIGVLDCGMVGRIDEELREQIEDMLLAAVDQDASRLTEIVVRLGQVPNDFDRERMQGDIDDFVADFRDQSLGELDLSGALNGIIGIIRRHRIVLPARIALLLKVLIMLEGTSRKLNPEFSLADLLKPYRHRAIQRRLSPARLWRRLQSAHRDWGQLIEIMPRDLADILERVKRGSFDVHLDHRRLGSTVNRLVLGIMTSSLFIGSALLWSRNVPPMLGGYSVPGAVGCAVAMFLGFRLLRAIKRSGDLE